ncbi:MAG: hypothetical protein HUJ90_01335 [Bacteroidales bacterium]|nr:hypothetical protein [Bacteroidales bacterium]
MLKKLLISASFVASAVIGACAQDANGYERKFVMEEFTGTWCGYCPRGIATMEYLKDTYGDRFIGISLHGNGSSIEPMAIPGGEYLSTLMDAFNEYGMPTGVLNRETAMDPYEAISYYAQHEGDVSDQKIDINSVFYDNAASGEVTVNYSVTSRIDAPDLSVSVAIVCIENDVQGEGKPYSQLSYFHKKYGKYTVQELKDMYPEIYPYLEFYVKGPQESEFDSGKYSFYIPADTMRYQEVARGIYPTTNGRKCNGEYQAGVSQSFTESFVMPSNVINWQNTAIIALLISNNTGIIINADKVNASLFELASIHPNYTDCLEEDAYYSLQGIRVDNPTNGIYIKRTGDIIRKVMIR